MASRRPARTFELYRGKDGQWYWRCLARNGNIVCDGGEGYARRSGAQKSLLRLLAGIAQGDYVIRPN